MRCEAELRDPRIVDEPALHHVPAHRALKRSEREDADELRRQTCRDPAPGDEPEQRQQERDSDRAPEQPMAVLPPEDALERVERHAAVDLAVFGRGLVLGEGLGPLRIGQRRQRADDRLPFGDGEARVREARHAADDNHGEEQRAAREQPRRDCSRITLARLRVARRRGQDNPADDIHDADFATALRAAGTRAGTATVTRC